MKTITFAASCAIAILSLSGCAGNDDRYRAELQEVRAIAIEAREKAEYAMTEAGLAAQSAAGAHEDAATAAGAAQAASERADRIYRANIRK